MNLLAVGTRTRASKWWIHPCACCDAEDRLEIDAAARRLGVDEDALRFALDHGAFPCAGKRRGRPVFCRTEVQVFALRPDLVDRLLFV